MKVIKPGDGTKEWQAEFVCTGKGNEGDGCGAVLLVTESDMFITESHALWETTTYLTFKCCECNRKTDPPTDQIPYAVQKRIHRRSPT